MSQRPGRRHRRAEVRKDRRHRWQGSYVKDSTKRGIRRTERPRRASPKIPENSATAIRLPAKASVLQRKCSRPKAPAHRRETMNSGQYGEGRTRQTLGMIHVWSSTRRRQAATEKRTSSSRTGCDEDGDESWCSRKASTVAARERQRPLCAGVRQTRCRSTAQATAWGGMGYISTRGLFLPHDQARARIGTVVASYHIDDFT